MKIPIYAPYAKDRFEMRVKIQFWTPERIVAKLEVI
jgi:hypothetical protein